GGVHGAERNFGKQGAHVAEVGDRDADLADLACGCGMIAVVASLGRQVEGDGEAGLALGKIPTIERVRLPRRGMPGVSAEDPGLIALSPAGVRWLGHVAADRWAPTFCSAPYPSTRRKRGSSAALAATGETARV